MMDMSNILNQAVIAVFGALALTVLGFVVVQWNKLGELIKQKKRESEASGADSFQSTLWSVAQEAYVFAEKNGKGIWESKSHQAFQYASDKMKLLGLNVTAEQLESKIEEAWVKLDKLPKMQSASIMVDEKLKEAVDKAVKH